jgi:hypothetical protein
MLADQGQMIWSKHIAHCSQRNLSKLSLSDVPVLASSWRVQPSCYIVHSIPNNIIFDTICRLPHWHIRIIRILIRDVITSSSSRTPPACFCLFRNTALHTLNCLAISSSSTSTTTDNEEDGPISSLFSIIASTFSSMESTSSSVSE